MKPETNNEIDLLLQRMARRDNAAGKGEVRVDDRHLDVDELSSYAQNALPVAARARYTEHLADCATCRKLVTELSLTLGAATVAAPVATADVPGGLKKFLASLFSPMVLRYAVPALGVVVVLVLGFVVWRRQAQSDFVAQLRQPQGSTPVAAPSPNAASAGIVNDSPSHESDKVESRNSKLDDNNPKAGTASAASAGVAPAQTAAAPSTDERALDKVQPAVAAEAPPPAPKPSATPEVEAQANTVVVKKQPEVEAKEKSESEAAKDRAYMAARNQQAAQPATATQSEARGQANANSSPSPGSVFGLSKVRPAKSPRAEESKSADDRKREDAARDDETRTADTETQTVAGRRFRKQGKVWIDTAYESSTATVNMTRDSDQFRALVADEPAIGTIAKQLDGEVIVVWKGRAYRIR